MSHAGSPVHEEGVPQDAALAASEPGESQRLHSPDLSNKQPPECTHAEAPSRDRQRREILESNAEIWQPACHLLWQPDGERWTKTTTVVVVVATVCWLKGLFSLYALLQGWETRPLYGLVILPYTSSGVITYFVLKILNPRAGELVQMCSFLPATEDEIAASRKTMMRSCVLAGTFAVIGAVFICVPLFSTAFDVLDKRLQAGEYGGHGDRWIGLGSYVVDVVAGMWVVVPMTVLFVYTLRLASSVSVTAARYVVNEIDKADRDIETNVTEALRLEIGPCVQTLVEEILVPLSSGWGLPVALLVGGFVLLAFLNLPMIIDVNSTPVEANEAAMSFVAMALCAVAVVYPPALVTTVCEDIKLMLNELRTAGVGTGHGMIDHVTDANITVIETWLCNLNMGQGPGFLLFGVVVSKRFVLTLASKIAGYVVIAVQALQQLQPSSETAGGVVDAAVNELGIGMYQLNITDHGVSIIGPN